ncbi:pirin family protein [Pontibacter sp. JH31]|uniref:Pirin family protein n=1 Tax=Pontibacter aquaedesilientis TaxID=2766980 RepID=A0ABR7XHJ2_9BACT|nr:pirin family protein [Pontibacter aquaedesilientis]MBD1397752.1 pirin family protein [Pontibacter aquaedesilientis]
MQHNRTVARLLYAEEVDMGGLPVRQPLPTSQVEQHDPFLLLHHHLATIPATAIPHKSGVGPHPHRGFSPVTFVYQGGVHHRDSRGNDSVVYAGGTQWMNAGMGIVHSERPPQDIQEHGGVQEIIQLWVNTPRAHKMDQPAYFPLQANDTPTVTEDAGRVQLAVVAGQYRDLKGPIQTSSPILAIRLTLKAGGTCAIPIPADYNAFLYLLDGQITLEGFGLVDGLHLVLLNRDGEGCTFTAKEDTRVLLMAGKLLEEPLAMHGPFVMNTQSEIMQAMRDYQIGKMGILIE